MVDVGVTGIADRAAAIAAFAAALRELRQSVGNPSFREMSGRSRAISHTTLHEAAQGNRLPSWATTVEFVKACDADPSAYRQRWDAANRCVRSAQVREPDRPEPERPTDPDAHTETETPTEATADPAPPEGPLRRRPVLLGVAAVVAAAVAVVGIVLAGSSNDSATPDGGAGSRVAGNPAAVPDASGVQFRSADCPVQQTNPPPAPPAHPGDHGRLVTDVTVPDCSHFKRGSTFVKVWRLRNLGTVPWRGYVLHRLDQPVRRDNCQTITDVPIADTAPGGFVDVRAEVIAPESPTFCVVRFRIFDAAGVDAFPGGRPINFQVNID